MKTHPRYCVFLLVCRWEGQDDGMFHNWKTTHVVPHLRWQIPLGNGCPSTPAIDTSADPHGHNSLLFVSTLLYYIRKSYSQGSKNFTFVIFRLIHCCLLWLLIILIWYFFLFYRTRTLLTMYWMKLVQLKESCHALLLSFSDYVGVHLIIKSKKSNDF